MGDPQISNVFQENSSQKCSENPLKFLKEKEVAAHLQLSQSYSLLGAHVARRLEEWYVRDTSTI